jgi:serine/threonine protein kinase
MYSEIDVKVIDRFRVIRLLGAGSFGEVYLCQDLVNGTSVAVKVLRDLQALDRFRREVRILYSQLDNAHVVRLIGYDLDATPPYLVLEYCEYGSLRQWVGRRPRYVDVCAALAHASKALERLHALGGVHRDVKPDNLLVARGVTENAAVVKLADFGLARTPISVTGPATRGGAGTPGYIAPEILEGAEFSPAADMFSLGITAVELLTGGRNLVALHGTVLPLALRQLVSSLIAPNPSYRPTAGFASTRFIELHSALGVPQTQSTEASNAGWAVLLGGGALLLAAILGGSQSSNPNAR